MSDEHVRPVSDKTMSARELLDGGYIQEVNRLFFHPLGLALGVDPDAEPRADGAVPMTVYDVRDDSEGMFFFDMTGVGSLGKAQKVREEAAEKRVARLARLRESVSQSIQPPVGSGFVVQPMGTRFRGDVSNG